MTLRKVPEITWQELVIGGCAVKELVREKSAVIVREVVRSGREHRDLPPGVVHIDRPQAACTRATKGPLVLNVSVHALDMPLIVRDLDRTDCVLEHHSGALAAKDAKHVNHPYISGAMSA